MRKLSRFMALFGAVTMLASLTISGTAQADDQTTSTPGFTIVQFTRPGSATNPSGTTSVSPTPQVASCEVRMDNPHTTTVNGAKVVKANATASCTNGYEFDQVTVNVQLYKTGAIWDYLQKSTSLSDTYVYSFSNEDTWVACKNTTSSTFYANTQATATINGLSGWTAYDYSPHISLPCGT